jgi:hypothetical protein
MNWTRQSLEGVQIGGDCLGARGKAVILGEGRRVLGAWDDARRALWKRAGRVGGRGMPSPCGRILVRSLTELPGGGDDEAGGGQGGRAGGMRVGLGVERA